MPFRLNSKTLGFTYSQVDNEQFTSLSLLNWLWAEHANYGPLYCCVSREHHKDGGTHYHVALVLARPINSRNDRQWDFLCFHPNILRPRNIVQWINYVIKDGEYEEQGTRPLPVGRVNGTPSEQEIMDKASNSTRVQFLCWAGVNKVTYAREIWTECQKKPLSRKTILSGQPIPGVIDPKFQRCMMEVNWIQEKCLILIGESGIGKTTYAKQIIPKPALFVTHIDDLKEFDPEFHKAILFDDVCFNHYPVQSQIHLVDFYDVRSVHIRYGTATIPAGTPKVFTCNEEPINIRHPAIQRRVQVVRCDVQSLRCYQ